MSNINDFSPVYTYRPGQAPQQNTQALDDYQRGENLRNVASAVDDFFVQNDNSKYDVDPRPGYVRLKGLEAPGLVETQTVRVDGYRTPDGTLDVTSDNDGSQTLLSVSKGGTEVYMDRPVYVNNRYLPTLETLTKNVDGTCGFSSAYYTARV